MGGGLGSKPGDTPTGSRLNGKNHALGWWNSPVPAGALGSMWLLKKAELSWVCWCWCSGGGMGEVLLDGTNGEVLKSPKEP